MAVVVVVVVAVLGGIAVALQAQFVGLMDSELGTTESVFVTYVSGGLGVALLMLALRGGNLGEMRALPWYVYLSGLLGLVIIAAIAFTVGRLGVVRALTIFTVAQFAFAAVIDHFGWLGAPVRPIDLTRVSGIVLLLAGVALVLR